MLFLERGKNVNKTATEICFKLKNCPKDLLNLNNKLL